MKNLSRSLFHAARLVVVLLAGGCAQDAALRLPPQPPPVAVAPLPGGTFTLGDLEKLRIQTEFYVRKVRQALPPKAAETLECEKRYAFAHSSVNGGIVDLQSLVAAGKDPAQSGEFTTKCAAAREEVNSFISLADAELLKVVAPGDRVRERSPATGEVTERAIPFAFIGVDVIASLGNWAWKQFSEARKVSKAHAEETKKSLATSFDKQRWRTFDEIAGPPPK